MSLYPLGISRHRDVPNLPSVPKQATGTIDLRWSFAGELACAFIDAPHQAVPPMLHAATLESIHRRICVLPVRFGIALRDETDICSLLQDRRQEFLDNLSRLDGTCEMGLRIAPPTAALRPCPPPRPQAAPFKPQSPLAYMEERRSHYRRVDEGEARDGSIVRQWEERLHGYYRQWRTLQSSPSHPVRLAFLVERNRVTAFRTRVENRGITRQEGQCVVLVPWPP